VFLLDTNILSELVRRQPHPKVRARFEAAPNHNLFTSAICVEEIRFGCRLVPHGEAKWRAMLAKVLSRVTVLDFTYAAAIRAGELRAAWRQAGTPVGYEDGLIAAATLVAGLTLVTRNVRHFDHVSGLTVENWFE
jgi:predicted nucleic acid-binding protein